MLHVNHSRHAQSPGSSLLGTRVAAHGKRAAPLLARFLLTAQGAGRPAYSLKSRVRHGALEQGNSGLNLRGTGEQRQFWGTENIGNQDFGEQGFISGEHIYPLGGPRELGPWFLLVLVWFLFYGPSTHFRSFRARSVNLATLFLGKPPRQFAST